MDNRMPDDGPRPTATGLVTASGEVLRFTVQGQTVCMDVMCGQTDATSERVTLTVTDVLTLSAMLMKACMDVLAQPERKESRGE